MKRELQMSCPLPMLWCRRRLFEKAHGNRIHFLEILSSVPFNDGLIRENLPDKLRYEIFLCCDFVLQLSLDDTELTHTYLFVCRRICLCCLLVLICHALAERWNGSSI